MKYSQKKECISFVFCCFENLSTAITLEPLVWFRWGFQQNVTWGFNQMENWKCHKCDFRLTDSPRSHHIFRIHLSLGLGSHHTIMNSLLEVFRYLIITYCFFIFANIYIVHGYTDKINYFCRNTVLQKMSLLDCVLPWSMKTLNELAYSKYGRNKRRVGTKLGNLFSLVSAPKILPNLNAFSFCSRHTSNRLLGFGMLLKWP